MLWSLSEQHMAAPTRGWAVPRSHSAPLSCISSLSRLTFASSILNERREACSGRGRIGTAEGGSSGCIAYRAKERPAQHLDALVSPHRSVCFVALQTKRRNMRLVRRFPKMQMHAKAVLIAFFFSANMQRDDKCVDAADDYCGGPGHEGSQAWQIEYARCMSDYWRSLHTDGNCPHPKIGCHCYQGCVQDRYYDTKDVGKYCVDTCTQANMPPSRDCGAK
ncbi:hypothetical protein V8E36_006841 [Tilletia maclaganii]